MTSFYLILPGVEIHFIRGGVIENLRSHWIWAQIVSLGFLSTPSYLLPTVVKAQITFERTYGGSSDDVGYSVQQTLDSGYIIAGSTGSFGAGGDVYLIKTDSLGDTLWTKIHGGSSFESCHSIQNTMNDGFIIAGATLSFGSGGSDVYLIKTDTLGDIIWTSTYGGFSMDWGNSLQPTTENGFVIAGVTRSFGAGNRDIYLIKTDSLGGTIWEKTYGGIWWEECHSIQRTADGGFIFTGQTESFGVGQFDVYLIKTDGNGQVVGIEESNESKESRVEGLSLKLFQNQPNPFHNFTIIHYTLSARIGQGVRAQGSVFSGVGKIPVRLAVYDITGRLVKTLMDEPQEPGVYQLPISNHQLPSNGIYFYQLESGGHRDTKKLILLR